MASFKPPTIAPPTTRAERGCFGALATLFVLFQSIVRQATRSLVSLPYQYVSDQRISGIPVLSINVGLDAPDGKMRHAKGLFAIGNQATGLIAIGFVQARGVIAVAPAALGLGAVGVASAALVSVSVVGVGLVSVSMFAIGLVSVGIIALGLRAVGIVSIGKSAVGIIGFGDAVRALFR